MNELQTAPRLFYIVLPIAMLPISHPINLDQTLVNCYCEQNERAFDV